MPRVKTDLSLGDLVGTVRVRTGIFRSGYRVVPGLYCAGTPRPDSPVLVTANYKLSFDALRRELAGMDVWILVVDTRGVNVWCAAGKGTFSTEEVALRIETSGLARIVSHRLVILPQFAATGVSVHALKRQSGFQGIFGPIRAADLARFFENNGRADETMRSVTFGLAERLVLIPVEICLLWKLLALVMVAIFLFSGVGPYIFSIKAAVDRGSMALATTFMAIVAGAVMTPILLPWLPGRQFWLKGVETGSLAGFLALFFFSHPVASLSGAAILLWTVAVSSYLAMNYTGSTPFTSLSGVEKEMRRGLPVQICCAGLAMALWSTAPFFG